MRKLILNIDGVKNKWVIPEDLGNISFTKGIKVNKLLTGLQNEINIAKVLELMLGCNHTIATYLLKNNSYIAVKIYLDIKELFKNGLGAELTTFSINKKYYRRKHIDELTVSEFIEFEKALYTTNPEIDMFNVLLRQCKPTLRMIGKSILRNKLTFYVGLKQPLKDDIINLQEVDENIPYAFGVVTVNEIINELNKLEEDFPSIFNQNNKGKPTFDESIFGEFECEEENDDTIVVNPNNKWSWYAILNKACNNDIIQRDVWLNKPIQELLTYISYLSDNIDKESKK